MSDEEVQARIRRMKAAAQAHNFKRRDQALDDALENFDDALEDATEEIQLMKETKTRQRSNEIGVTPIDTSASGTVSARPPRQRVRIEIPDKRLFLYQPAPKVGLIECHIYREVDGVQKMYPKYILTLEQDKTMLMTARKRKKNTCSNYIISLDDEMTRGSSSFFGKVKSNFVGTEFSIFDNGPKPQESSASLPPRQHLGCVVYETNILGTKGPRKMQVAIPEVSADGRRHLWQPNTDDPMASFTEQYKAGNHSNIMALRNKEPQWNENLRAYVLNFNGRVTKPSVKNFQLVEPSNQDMVLMQFGKVGKNDFTLDFQYPMSGLQAFAIALSSFDHKLACE
eukprot:NODE_3350_length_1367_cov_41.766077_g2915_i0.p1 GENE.NODE_3350_length_1367_cov_41.766077_g2915_i0~~NODE_3350_length_1367_cov_41.766077_g2915_i0.p1  ORF type:complete len:358 (-),score=52.42 NODE_3350_length_1367_cov_41.766077_g2915_i0:294-1313(-)